MSSRYFPANIPFPASWNTNQYWERAYTYSSSVKLEVQSASSQHGARQAIWMSCWSCGFIGLRTSSVLQLIPYIYIYIWQQRSPSDDNRSCLDKQSIYSSNQVYCRQILPIVPSAIHCVCIESLNQNISFIIGHLGFWSDFLSWATIMTTTLAWLEMGLTPSLLHLAHLWPWESRTAARRRPEGLGMSDLHLLLPKNKV